MSIEEFVSKQLDLLAEEHCAEVEENRIVNSNIPLSVLKRKGLCIPKLEVASVKTGLYGRTVAKFGLKSGESLPCNVFKAGDIVGLGRCPTETSNSGIVSHVSEKFVSVAFDNTEMRDQLDSFAQNHNSLTLMKLANEVTYKRLKKVLGDLKKYTEGPAQHLIEVLFGHATPPKSNHPDLKFVNSNLNECQQNAVKFALSQNQLAIIHGPPGTGKTTTVVEVIAQLVKSGRKVLACAPSNVAVDNLVEKLSRISGLKSGGQKIKVVRIGHPARILEHELKQMSLDALVSHSDAAAIVRDVRSDIENMQKKLSHCPDKGKRHSLRQERKLLFSELKQREKKALTEILSSADVILATNVGAHSKGPLQHLPPDHFDDVIIDECGQSLEAACWISILRARRCILAGDHLQLPPTIISHKAAENGLSTTLLERMINMHGEQVVAMLTEQYRMHAHIMQWASNGMYDGKLVANYAVQSHLLSDLPHVEQTEDTGIPMLLIDTSGCDMGEMESEESISKANEGEAMIVCAHVDSLVKAGVGEREIAVISPYNLQVDILRQMLKEKHPNIEIKSVDGFQGREKEAVILTLVRSNPHKEIGFLSDRRRLNVAVTRARRHLTVICDSTTVCNDKFIKSLVDHITKHGEVRTGFEYADDDLQSSNNLRPVNYTMQASKKQSKKTSPKPAMPQLTLIEIQAKYQYIIEQLLGQRNILKGRSESTLFNFSELTIKQIISENSTFDNSKTVVIKNVHDHFEISFPAALNSAERKAIHNLCEEMGFGHQSIGEDKERQVVISVPALDSPDNILPEIKQEVKKQTTTETMDKDILTPVESIERFDLCVSTNTDCQPRPVVVEPTHNADDTENQNDFTSSIGEGSDSPNTTNDVVYSICEKCGKQLPEDNMTMHLIHCERLIKMKEQVKTPQNEIRKKIHSQPSKSKNKKNTKSANKVQQQRNTGDFDLLNEAISSNKFCFHSNCAASVTTTGQLCSICRKTFCLKHHIPEVHGCGTQAHINARRQIIRDRVLYSGSGVPDRKPDLTKRAQLKHRLDSKMKSLEKERKSGKNQRS